MNIYTVIIPMIVLIIIIHGIIKKVDLYDTFIAGSKEGLTMTITLFPCMLGMIIAINILIKSNIIGDSIVLLTPMLEYLNFPKELLPLSILRPISGSATLALLNNIFTNFTPDSYIGKLASVIQGSTDTTIYIIGLYFGSVGIKKVRYALIAGLLTDFVTIVVATIIVNLLL